MTTMTLVLQVASRKEVHDDVSFVDSQQLSDMKPILGRAVS